MVNIYHQRVSREILLSLRHRHGLSLLTLSHARIHTQSRLPSINTLCECVHLLRSTICVDMGQFGAFEISQSSLGNYSHSICVAFARSPTALRPWIPDRCADIYCPQIQPSTNSATKTSARITATTTTTTNAHLPCEPYEDRKNKNVGRYRLDKRARKARVRFCILRSQFTDVRFVNKPNSTHQNNLHETTIPQQFIASK